MITSGQIARMGVRAGMFLIAIVASFAARADAALITAHRGDSRHAPENTIAAINSAIGKADASEMDVRVTVDGELLLMHDAKVNRTTNGSGRVARQTLSQITALDAGSWFAPEFAGEPVPTLGQAIDAALAGGLLPMIERKSGSAESFHNQFSDLGLLLEGFRVISFDWNFLEDMHALNPDYNLGALGWGRLSPGKIRKAVSKGADFVSWRHNSVRTQDLVDLVHTHDLELHVWTVNQPIRMQELIGWGVDGITTDDPAALQQLMLPQFASLSSLAIVPEPGGWCLLLVGGLLVTRRMRAGISCQRRR